MFKVWEVHNNTHLIKPRLVVTCALVCVVGLWLFLWKLSIILGIANTNITVALIKENKEHCWNSIIEKNEHNLEDPRRLKSKLCVVVFCILISCFCFSALVTLIHRSVITWRHPRISYFHCILREYKMTSFYVLDLLNWGLRRHYVEITHALIFSENWERDSLERFPFSI